MKTRLGVIRPMTTHEPNSRCAVGEAEQDSHPHCHGHGGENPNTIRVSVTNRCDQIAQERRSSARYCNTTCGGGNIDFAGIHATPYHRTTSRPMETTCTQRSPSANFSLDLELLRDAQVHDALWNRVDAVCLFSADSE